MTLLSLQRDFRKALLGEVDDAATCIGAETASAGVEVYHYAYRAQLIECLRETFEKLHAWLGEEAFATAALAHIADHPPHGWTLGAYGEGFDVTLSRLYPGDPEVAEMAWLEWSLSIAFSGRDATVIAADTLAKIDWDHARLAFAPTLQLGKTTTNVGAIWSALSTGDVPPAATTLPAPAALIVWKQDYSPSFRTIDEDEETALIQMLGGATFGDLCSLQIEHRGVEEGVSRAGMLLGQWLHDGLITGVSDKQPNCIALDARASPA